MQPPPLLPEKVLARVERVGRLHGGGVLYVAGVCALYSATSGDSLGAIVGLAVAGAGAVEHHGAALVAHGEPRGVQWLVRSQAFIFVSLAAYAFIRLNYFEPPALPEDMRPLLEANAALAGVSVPEFVVILHRLTLNLIPIVSLFYQGGLGLYYFSKRHAIAQALEGDQ